MPASDEIHPHPYQLQLPRHQALTPLIMRSSFPSLFFAPHEVTRTPPHSQTTTRQNSQRSSNNHSPNNTTEPRPHLDQRPSLSRRTHYKSSSSQPVWTVPVTESKVSGSEYFPSREVKGGSKLTFGSLPNRASVEHQGSQRPRTSHGVFGRRTPVRERVPTPYPESRANGGDYFKNTVGKST